MHVENIDEIVLGRKNFKEFFHKYDIEVCRHTESKYFMQNIFLFYRNTDFSMFDSSLDHKDLIFQDSTVRLIPVEKENQNYESFLGPSFVRSMERMEGIDCVTTAGATTTKVTYINIVIGLLSTLYLVLSRQT